MKLLHDLKAYEIWTDGISYNIYDGSSGKLMSKFPKEIFALKWVTQRDYPKNKDANKYLMAIEEAHGILKQKAEEAQAIIDIISDMSKETRPRPFFRAKYYVGCNTESAHAIYFDSVSMLSNAREHDYIAAFDESGVLIDEAKIVFSENDAINFNFSF